MWEKALLDIAKKVGSKKALGPQTHKHGVALGAPSSLQIQHRLQDAAYRPPPSSGTVGILDAVSSDVQSAASQARLESHVSLPYTPLTSGDLVKPILNYSFPHAVEALCVLIKAGQRDNVAYLLSSWTRKNTSTRRTTSVAKANAQRALEESIWVVASLRDASTLRSMATILESSVNGMSRFRSSESRCSYGVLPREDVTLLECLGEKRTYYLFVETVKALCELGEADGITLYEKALFIDGAATAFSHLRGGGGLPVIPYSLQDFFCSDRQDGRDLNLVLQETSPHLVAAFCHPSQYSVSTTLSLTKKEIRKLQEEDAMKTVSRGRTNKQWQAAFAQFLPQSRILARSQENYKLQKMMLGYQEVKQDELDSIRKSIIESLQSHRHLERKAVGRLLLENYRLFQTLRISPISVFTTYALSFYSKKHTPHRFLRATLMAIPRLYECRRFEDVAQLSWNHLSVQCPTTVSMLKHDRAVFDMVSACICKTMRAHSFSSETWMGHRSLALLRVGNQAGLVTPLHSITICAAAMDTGVHFSTINEIVNELFENDERTRTWVINMIRICADSNDTLLTIECNRRGLGQWMKSLLNKLLQSLTADASSHERGVSTYVPSRSKQLALWRMSNDPTINPALLAMVNRIFLDEKARQCFLSGDFLTDPIEQQTPSAQQQTTSIVVQPQNLINQVLAWETVAALASNCTTEKSYTRMLRSLASTSFASDRDADEKLFLNTRISQLIESEVDC